MLGVGLSVADASCWIRAARELKYGNALPENIFKSNRCATDPDDSKPVFFRVFNKISRNVGFSPGDSTMDLVFGGNGI